MEPVKRHVLFCLFGDAFRSEFGDEVAKPGRAFVVFVEDGAGELPFQFFDFLLLVMLADGLFDVLRLRVACVRSGKCFFIGIPKAEFSIFT